jgi:osmotically-inducible protein OsmY
MRQFAAVLILVSLFVLLVGTRFKASDGERLRAASRAAAAKIRNAMPPELTLAAPVDALRKELPSRPDEAVRERLASDRRLAGVEFKVTAEGSVVTLRGLAPSAGVKRFAVEVAENTVGVEKVVDELAVPTE